ncbi:BA75_01765T0 [Komagataella pastoris]|uniref:BA75_01765T0 n=1 Tax=Komagataella pastoris TaxID=4922 RepID=A0A1B2J9W8_PICPA|nr:BA75_01765T0 [Komagataella pastoris]
MTTSEIYIATYSSVDVYECICNTFPLMRRCSDDWVNVTQILKIAQFPKAQRTKILEKEVHDKTHQRIQGGYGRFQGTWTPLDIARNLAMNYGFGDSDLPVLYWDPSKDPMPKRNKQKPTPAKHNLQSGNNSTGSPKRRRATPKKIKQQVQLPVQHTFTNTKLEQPAHIPQYQLHDGYSQHPPLISKSQHSQQYAVPQVNTYIYSQPPTFQQQQQLLQQQQQHPQPQYTQFVNNQQPIIPSPNNFTYNQNSVPRFQNFQTAKAVQAVHTSQGSLSTTENWSQDELHQHGRKNSDTSVSSNVSLQNGKLPHDDSQLPTERPPHLSTQQFYTELLLNYFTEDNEQVPYYLVEVPEGFNLDIPIDDEGHTALHWAASIGSVPVVEALLKNRADPLITNNSGLNALSKLVGFNNSYELMNFSQLLHLLKDCLIIPDANGRIPLHYMMELTSIPDKIQPLEYYFQGILEFVRQTQRLAETASPDNKDKDLLKILLNHQDNNGDSSLHIAARSGNAQFIKLLLSNGASVELVNRRKQSCKDMLSIDLLEKLHWEDLQKVKRTSSKSSTQRRSRVNSSDNKPSLGIFNDQVSYYPPVNNSILSDQSQMSVVPASSQIHNQLHQRQQLLSPEMIAYNPSIPQDTPKTVSQCDSSMNLSTSEQEANVSFKELREKLPNVINNLNETFETEMAEKDEESEHYSKMINDLTGEAHYLEKTIARISQEISSRMNMEQNKMSTAVFINEANKQVSRMTEDLNANVEELTRLWERSQSLQLAKLVHRQEEKHLEHTEQPNEKETAIKLAIDLSILQFNRMKLVNEIIHSLADVNVNSKDDLAGNRLYKYKKLISKACGLQIEDVDDDLLNGIEQTLLEGGSI